MNIFDEVRGWVSIEDAARLYGLRINQHGKALCPFHEDHNPSMSFKYNHYRCWACGASGSVIDLTANLLGLSPLDAVKQLNSDFGLMLDLDGPISTMALEARKRDDKLISTYELWEQRMRIGLGTYYRQLYYDMINYAPASYNDKFCPRYVKAANEIDQIEYLLNVFDFGGFKEKVELYRNRTEVEKYLERIHNPRGKITDTEKLGQIGHNGQSI